MAHFDFELFRQEVTNIVSQIPRIARLSGYPSHARQVGRALHGMTDKAIPCHRVVDSVGRTAPNWPAQRTLLAAENVCFKANGNVDLRRSQWDYEAEEV